MKLRVYIDTSVFSARFDERTPERMAFTKDFFDRITEFFGLDDIDFESAEFSRKFFVKAKDKRWAYDVIHTRTMQFLLDMPQFTMQFDPLHAIAHRSSKFKTGEFEAAAEVIVGILDRLPDYLVKQMQGEG